MREECSLFLAELTSYVSVIELSTISKFGQLCYTLKEADFLTSKVSLLVDNMTSVMSSKVMNHILGLDRGAWNSKPSHDEEALCFELELHLWYTENSQYPSLHQEFKTITWIWLMSSRIIQEQGSDIAVEPLPIKNASSSGRRLEQGVKKLVWVKMNHG
ncbi:hypothetical protein GOP47_0005060 [Adiantum capillus-veneris]|uniref:Uncharacterized protein n=1 Tax=Adiantum capillus-veneris TaxID=13818 RepID=A0A9D4V5A1_ADICA|nr:hypothetical protein GOP47_0005060 [Adiantum capillus-veneris]